MPPDDAGAEDEDREPLVVDENARLAPRGISDSAIVGANSVSFPSTEETRTWAASLEPGRVIAGNRDTTTSFERSKNPLGFLRKVVSVRMGDPIVIATEPADLTDLMQGDLRFDDPSMPSIFPDAPVARILPSSLRPLDDTSTGTGSSNGVSTTLQFDGGLRVSMSNGNFSFGASLKGDYELKKKWFVPTGVKTAFAELTLKPSIRFDIDVDAEGSVKETKGVDLIEANKKEVELPGIPMIPVGPIPLTVSIKPVFECSAGMSGKVHVNATASAGAEFVGGFRYQSGEGLTTHKTGPSFQPPSVTVNSYEGGGILSASCAVKVSVGVYAFDVLGISAAVGPDSKIEVKLCGDSKSGAAASISRSLNFGVSLNANVKVPFTSVDVVQTPIISPITTSLAKDYLVGDATTCCEQLTCH